METAAKSAAICEAGSSAALHHQSSRMFGGSHGLRTLGYYVLMSSDHSVDASLTFFQKSLIQLRPTFPQGFYDIPWRVAPEALAR